MKKDDKQFFDGLLLGSILIGIVLIVLILYAFYRTPQPLVDVQQKQAEEGAQVSQPVPEELDTTYESQINTTTTYNTNPYLIIDEQVDVEEKYVYRLLAPVSDDHQIALDKALQTDTPTGCLDSLSGFSDQVLTIWDIETTSLILADEAPLDSLPGTICPIVRKWSQGKLIIQFAYGDAGVANNTIYTYSLEKEVEEIINSVTIFQNIGIDDTRIVSWAHDGIILGQQLSSEKISGIYNITGENHWEITNISDFPLVYETNLSAQTDLLSDFNLRNYTKGLEYFIGGERVVLQWNQK